MQESQKGAIESYLESRGIDNKTQHRGRSVSLGPGTRGANPTPKSIFFPLAGSPETRSGPLPFVLLFHDGIHSTHGFWPVVSPLLALNLLSFLPPPNFSLTTIQ